MRRDCILALCALLLAPLLYADLAAAQRAAALEEEEPQNAREAIDQMRAAPRSERSERREAVVGFGQEAVDLLLEEVRQLQQAEDVNFVANCIVALGELKAEPATDELMAALDSNYLQIGYVASVALGEIWQGRGASEPAARDVNAALLAFLYSDLPAEVGYGPAIALNEINAMRLVRPANMAPDKLLGEVDRWTVSNPNALPSPDQQPWELNLRVLLTSQDSAARQAALQALRQKRSLRPVEGLLEALADGSAAAPRAQLASLLGELTGVPFPPPAGGASTGDPVEDWRGIWLRTLRQSRDDRMADYAWEELERALRRYNRSPDEQKAQRIRDYRLVLLHQVDSTDQIPGAASPKARELLEAPLEVKQTVEEAVSVLEGQPTDFEKADRIETIKDELTGQFRREIGGQFMSRLYALARDENNELRAEQLGNILWLISGVPCRLEAPSLEGRRRQLDEWRQDVEARGLTLQIAAP